VVAGAGVGTILNAEKIKRHGINALELLWVWKSGASKRCDAVDS
jgi:hypothetical protein